MGIEPVRAVFAAILAGSFVAAPIHAQEAPLTEAQHRVFEEGQVWEYSASNSGDDGALIIQRIDPAENGDFPFDVYHISMIVDMEIGGMEQLEVGHLPVARETLDTSVTELSERDMTEFADWDEGYAQWQRAKGGVFDISIEEIIEVLVGMMAETPAQLRGHSSPH